MRNQYLVLFLPSEKRAVRLGPNCDQVEVGTDRTVDARYQCLNPDFIGTNPRPEASPLLYGSFPGRVASLIDFRLRGEGIGRK